MAIHEQLDIAYWKQVFSVSRLREEARGKPATMQPQANMISGPYDIAVIEQLREESFANIVNIKRLPTDIFVWNRGEPAQRAVTKISGLPYREAGKPWPVTPSGTPMNFVAQFCFVDSCDILPPLPGSILLVFIEGKEWRYEDKGGYNFAWGSNQEHENSFVTFEWTSLGNFPLTTQAEMPENPWQIMPCYGSIYRTYDYPTTDGFAYANVAQHIPEILEATKIGGVCPSPWIPQKEEETGKYLCSLSSVFPYTRHIYPFLNMAEPLSTNEWQNIHPLLIGDVGLMNIFLSTDGTLRWRADAS